MQNKLIVAMTNFGRSIKESKMYSQTNIVQKLGFVVFAIVLIAMVLQ